MRPARNRSISILPPKFRNSAKIIKNHQQSSKITKSIPNGQKSPTNFPQRKLCCRKRYKNVVNSTFLRTKRRVCASCPNSSHFKCKFFPPNFPKGAKIIKNHQQSPKITKNHEQIFSNKTFGENVVETL